MQTGPTSLPFQQPLRSGNASGLVARIAAIVVVLGAEMLLLSIWLDNDALIARGGTAAFVGNWAAWVVRCAVASIILFAAFVWLKHRAELAALDASTRRFPPSLLFALAHICLMGCFIGLSRLLYGSNPLPLSTGLLLSLWLAAGLGAIASAVLAILPASLCIQWTRRTASLAALSITVVIAACIAGNYLRLLWEPTAGVTFLIARALLAPFVSSIVADPATRILGTPGFNVQIAPECSGLEGVGLILVFSLCLLWLFRNEFRFPRAFLLVPIGAIAIFLLNAVRIAALILIGNAGAAQVALGGFHSQAGWIMFNAVALGYCVVATRLPWFLQPEALDLSPIHRTATHAGSRANPASAYLLPFLAILAAGMLGAAAGIRANWLYLLRVPAAAITLLYFRRRYTSLDWKSTWLGPLVGVIVFALWIGFDALQHPATDTTPTPLISYSTALRFGWIALRIASAVLTVPIAEELAFRGFLIRRFISADFDSLPLTCFTWPALLISSLAFGLLHGRLWLPGTLAGLAYAFVMFRRGRIGEAVIAHATTNALLAAFVLTSHKWHLWQ